MKHIMLEAKLEYVVEDNQLNDCCEKLGENGNPLFIWKLRLGILPEITQYELIVKLFNKFYIF